MIQPMDLILQRLKKTGTQKQKCIYYWHLAESRKPREMTKNTPIYYYKAKFFQTATDLISQFCIKTAHFESYKPTYILVQALLSFFLPCMALGRAKTDKLAFYFTPQKAIFKQNSNLEMILSTLMKHNQSLIMKKKK